MLALFGSFALRESVQAETGKGKGKSNQKREVCILDQHFGCGY